jgi:mercuric ion transport protein
MRERRLLATGVLGSTVAAVCCFTPVLAIGLGAVGLTTWLGWLDDVLFPVWAVFLGIAVYAWGRMWRRAAAHVCCDVEAPGLPGRP